MNFNCNDCSFNSANDGISAPSVTVSIIDEFAGLSYGKYCKYECAKNDLNKYFDNPKDVEIVETVKAHPDFLKAAENLITQMSNKVKLDEIKSLDQKVIWTQILLDQMSYKSIEEDEKYLIAPTQLSKKSEELNSIWNDDSIDDKMRCRILAYWLSSHDETKNLNVSSPQNIIFPNDILNGATVVKTGSHPIIVTKMGVNEFLVRSPSADSASPLDRIVLKSEVKFY
jgi:hypothetical protein